MEITHIYLEGYDDIAPNSDGIPSIIYNISTNLIESDHEVNVITRNFARETVPDKNINYHRIDVNFQPAQKEIRNQFGILEVPLRRLPTALKVVRILRENSESIVHFHEPFIPAIISIFAPNILDRAVYTAHLGEEKQRLGLQSKLLPSFIFPDVRLVRKSSQVTVLNEQVKRLIHDNYAIPANKIHTIPNGVNIQHFTPDLETSNITEKYNIGDEFVILFIGTITPRKGVDVLVESANELHKYEEKFKVIIAGDTTLNEEYSSEISQMISDYGLSDHIDILGYTDHDDLRKLRVSADVFVGPSREEGFGMVFTEAMASGLPVIGSKVGGIPDQIENGVNGYLIPPNEPEILAEKIRHLLRNPSQKERMARESRNRALEFSWDRITNEYIKVYEQVFNQ